VLFGSAVFCEVFEVKEHYYENQIWIMDKDQLSLELECPVCFQTPRNPPIFQCENGHLICCACHPKMSTCPQVESKISWILQLDFYHRSLQYCKKGKCKFSGVRCRLAENILEKSNLPRPCKFSTEGCLFEDEIANLEPHEGEFVI